MDIEKLLVNYVTCGIATIVCLLFGFYIYLTYDFNYWKKKNIHFLKPTPLIGNCKDLLLLRRTAGHFLADLYEKAPKSQYVGIFILGRPALLVRDPELIKNILVKDFNTFADRFTSSDEKFDPLGSKNLLTRKGESWKYLRAKLSPTFSSGKMKNMYHLVTQCFEQLMDHIDTYADTKSPLEIKDVLARCTTDIISSCAFGIESNSIKNPNAEFREIGKKVFEYTRTRAYETLVFLFAPHLVKTGRFSFFQKDVTTFLRKIFWEMINHREKSKTTRNDLIDLLIQIKNKGKVDDDVSENTDYYKRTEMKDNFKFDFNGDDLTAQAAIFFTAGFETSSTTMSFTLYELSLQPKIQEKLREEILTKLKETNGKITYDGILNLKYLDMVISETLRKYPPLPFLDRVALQNYRVPGTTFTIDKGTPIYIPILAIQMDPQYFPDPEKYNPENFSEEAKQSRHSCTWLAFGDGPRHCVGMRFGLMVTKAGLVHILSKYRVEPCSETPIPLQFNNWAVILQSVGGIPLNFKSLSP